MRILISGATGFVGSAAVEVLQRDGHSIVRLARPASSSRSGKTAGPGEAIQSVRWDPVAGELDGASAEGMDALVHLAGASIAEGRWSAARKSLLRTSRVDATRHLIGALAKLQRPPRVVVAASAIGYFGDRGDEELTEASAPGNDFLAKLCVEWEAESARAEEFGARVVILRFGIVLAAHGGALPQMALPFKFGAGGRLGAGRQWMSWIALEDVVGVIRFALSSATLSGPVNTVSSQPVQNAEFTRVLARALHRPAIFPAPAFALRLALGEMADALLLSSQRVFPAKLLLAGYNFQQTDLSAALAAIYRRVA